jgi:hypothetical protein
MVWAETSGLCRVVLYNFVGYGLELQHGYGGAAYLPLRDIEIFAAAGALAVRVAQTYVSCVARQKRSFYQDGRRTPCWKETIPKRGHFILTCVLHLFPVLAGHYCPQNLISWSVPAEY